MQANPRVQAHAGAALVNFLEQTEREVVAPYPNDLLAKLLQALQSGKKIVQEQVCCFKRLQLGEVVRT